MLYFRFTSPLCWLTAIVFFFLPWLNLCCVENGEIHTFATLSGAELAWGGIRTCVAESPERITWHDWKYLAAYFMLAAYALGLSAASVYMLRRHASVRRAWTGIKLACILTCLLLLACCMLFDGDPFLNWDTTSLTKWYYGSYIVNVLAVLIFGLEWWWMRRIEKRAQMPSAQADSS
jgi:hypothetical protein